MGAVQLIYGQNDLVAQWVAKTMKPPFDRGFGNSTAIGVALDGALIGGTVFHDYSPEAGIIEMSSAATSPRWLAPKMIHAIFTYVFDQIQCQAVIMRVREDNARMVRIAQRFGFHGALLPRLSDRETGLWVFTLFDDDWREHRANRKGGENR